MNIPLPAPTIDLLKTFGVLAAGAYLGRLEARRKERTEISDKLALANSTQVTMLSTHTLDTVIVQNTALQKTNEDLNAKYDAERELRRHAQTDLDKKVREVERMQEDITDFQEEKRKRDLNVNALTIERDALRNQNAEMEDRIQNFSVIGGLEPKDLFSRVKEDHDQF